jgi:predicted amidohydrolase YtcJ
MAKSEPEDVLLEEIRIRYSGHVVAAHDLDIFYNIWRDSDPLGQTGSKCLLKPLRWTFAHLDQVNAAQLERMKKLGMYAAIHSRPSIQRFLMRATHGATAGNMPPLRLVQDSGVRWGWGRMQRWLPSVNPFLTLWWATTGKMVGGTKVTDQALSRAEALIPYTRSNAYLLFQESNLGSI